MSQIEDLKALLDGTPLAVERVAAIWPGLAVMDKATLLALLMSSKGAINHSPHRERFLDVALSDDNAYIRYLAAGYVHRPRDGATPMEVERYSKIQHDPSPLVRSAEAESNDWNHLDFQPGAFWEMPQTCRLAAVTGIKHGGEKFAKLLVYAGNLLLPESKVTEDEMVDVVRQYLTWKTLEKRLNETEKYSISFEDGYAEYSAGKDLDALWESIPNLPRNVGFILLDHLPEEGCSGGVRSDVLNSLDAHQRQVLLYRQDIRLDSWRREQFEKAEDKNTRLAALANPRFQLNDSVISALVFRAGESQEEGLKKFDELQDLANFYYGASMAQSSAIAKLLRNAPNAVSKARMFSDNQAFNICERRVKTLDRTTVEAEFRDLQLLEMVWKFVPMDGEITDQCPAVFRSHMVSGNPWASYLHLKEADKSARNFDKEGFELKRAIEKNRSSWNFGLPIPSELWSDPVAPVEENRQDALMQNLSLKLNELRASVDRIRFLMWIFIAALVLLLIFRR